jgi:hypothetical protein
VTTIGPYFIRESGAAIDAWLRRTELLTTQSR